MFELSERTDKNTVRRAVKKRPDDANKGTMGTLLCVCGCYSMAGAAIMAGKAALRSGIGLLKLALPGSIYPIAAQAMYESVFLPLDETPDGRLSAKNLDLLLEQADKAQAVLIGCGLGVCDDTKALTRGIITETKTPVVLDADGLNCICDEPWILKRAKASITVTPHPGEMARLLGTTAARVNLDRASTALSFSSEYGVVTVLKGAGTVIASPDGKALLNTTGNSGMAAGGSGDVLAGITGTLTAQGTDSFYAAAAAVYLHGLAGDLAAQKFGKISMLPTDIIECLPKAFAQCGL